MPSEGSDQVADSVATDISTVRTEVEGEAEGVEENPPPTVEPGTGVSSSWADLSEVQDAPVPTEAAASSSLGPVKEEIDEELQIQEALKLSAVLSTIGLVDEVADDPVATEVAAPEAELDLSIFDTVTEPANPAQAAFDDIDQLRDNPAVDLPTTSEPVPVETIDLLDLGDDSFEHRVIAEASEASVPDPARSLTLLVSRQKPLQPTHLN